MRLVAVSVAAAAAVGAQAASAAQAPIRVVGFSTIGGFVVKGGTPASARHAFGTTTLTRQTSDHCTMTWPGIRMGFYTLLDKPQCAPDSSFADATISRPWITDRGLRQGDTVAKAKTLYPPARKAKPGAAKLNLVVRFSQAIGEYGLTARVKNGHVTVLDIVDPQGGE
jgi:hypothetical protein